MSNKTQLQANNTQLASLISTLQGKAAGGGGASVETCTVSISYCGQVYYTGVENGVMVAKSSVYTNNSATHQIEACKGMPIVCGHLYDSSPSTMPSAITKLGSYSTYIYAFTASENASVTFYEIGGAN